MSMTLRKILDEPVLLRGFSDFCKVQHAYENLEFWLTVDMFRETFADLSSPTSPKAGSPIISPTNRKSTRGRTFWSAITSNGIQRNSSKSNLGDDKDMILQANKIYETFLAPNAEKWVCVDQIELEDVKRRLDENLVDAKMFDVVQKQVFVNMEKDLLPRFSKSFDTEDSVFQSAPPPRGSVRFVPDQKLRATLVKTAANSISE